MNNADEFVIACKKVEKLTDIELIDVYFENVEDDVFEDDGFLHVTRFGARAVFDVGEYQSLESAEQNENTKLILCALGIKIMEKALARKN